MRMSGRLKGRGLTGKIGDLARLGFLIKPFDVAL